MTEGNTRKIADLTTEATLWIALGSHVIISVASAVVLIIVCCFRKRAEFGYIATPVSFFLSGLVGSRVDVKFIKEGYIGGNLQAYEMGVWIAFTYMLIATGHQYFASQYLQTSYTLPITFSEAKL